MKFVLGIDGGGTKTACVISNLKGEIIGIGKSGSSHYPTLGKEKTKNSLKESIECAIKRSEVEIPSFEIAYLGMTGGSKKSRVRAIESIMNELDVAKRNIVDHDASIALAGATGLDPGAIIASGTGSIAFGMENDGNREKVGGWGHVLGDEGSGYDIGRKGLVSIFRYYDGRGKETILLSEVKKHLEISDIEIVRDWIFKDNGVDKSKIASIAKIVIESAKKGDKVSERIINDAIRELSLLGYTIVKKLKTDERRFKISLIGGIFREFDHISNPVKKRIEKKFSNCTVIDPILEPVFGAVLQALNKKGIEINKSIISNIKETSKNFPKI